MTRHSADTASKRVQHRARRLPGLAVALGLAIGLSACQMTLYSDMTQAEANRMVAALISAGVPANRVASGEGIFAVEIDEADMPRAMAALERAGLPRQGFASLGDVFAKEGILSSPTEERARLVYAMSQELSETLSLIDGVLSARIHVVLPEEGGIGGAAQQGSASVFLRHRAEADLEALIPDIKMLVTKSIANLSYDQVSVIRVAAPATEGDAAPQMLDRAFGVWVLDADADRLRWLLGLLAAFAAAAVAANGAWFWLWRTGRLRSPGDAAAAVSTMTRNAGPTAAAPEIASGGSPETASEIAHLTPPASPEAARAMAADVRRLRRPA